MKIKNILVLSLFLLSLTINIGLAQRPDPPLPLIDYIGKSVKSKEVRKLKKWLKKNGYKKNMFTIPYKEYNGFARGIGKVNFRFYMNEDKTITQIYFNETFRLTKDGFRPQSNLPYKNVPSEFEVRESCSGTEANIDLPKGLMLHSVDADKYIGSAGSYVVGKKPVFDKEPPYRSFPKYIVNCNQKKYDLPQKARPLLKLNTQSKKYVFTCISGDCTATEKAEMVEVKYMNGDHYQGYFVNNAPHGSGVFTIPATDSTGKVVYEGSFNNGLLVGQFIVKQYNQFYKEYELTGKTDDEGRVLEAEGKIEKGSKIFFIEFTTEDNNYLDLSKADPEKMPGKLAFYECPSGKKWDYKYVISTTGYLVPLCLHSFKDRGESRVRHDISGKEDYRTVRFSNGKAIDYDGPFSIPETCN